MKLFLNACGLEDAFSLKVEDRSRGEAYEVVVERPYVVIGRSADADLKLDHWQISRRHTYLQVVEGGVFCLDLGSRTGTHWEGKAARWRWLAHRQPIQVGPYRIWSLSDREGSSDGSDSTDDFAPSTHDYPGVSLHELNESSDGDSWRIRGPVTLIGRSPSCHICIPDQVLSKFQASLVRTSNGLFVVDLLGTVAVSVNGSRIRSARLNEGDELVIGPHAFRVSYDDPATMPNLNEEEPYTSAGTGLMAYDSAANRHGVPAMSHVQGYAMPFPETPMSPALPESVAIAQALLAPMLNQFAAMQQQMFEQFHQTMMMMMQSMHITHRERMESVERELAEVRRLTAELYRLQAEAARAPTTEIEPVSQPAKPSGGHRPAQSTSPARPSSSGPPRSASPPSPARVPDQAEPKPTSGKQPPSSSTPTSRPDHGAAASRRTEQPQARPRASSTEPPSSTKASGPSEPPPQRSRLDPHSSLQQRINALQTERQTRWQKILTMVGVAGEGRE
jgi:pSer/pThr/pTyr-binding forkhead associated (FHA) protein